ncbi:Argininosuccinate synthase [Planctomycetes bacterium Poly30]|uniref:Argininosuccinate synthase n=1 Tax=Saltatorellus ferox TaxID=2528018 RepID=A0A518EYQ1_9BACT|nr:Argininosuccinate synthase [Planctomycetes bacterium Poly30]
MTDNAQGKKVVLAYSGGLDTSIIIPWLKERGYEVHCLAGDVGQGAEELVGLEEKAAATGAASCKVADLREAFVTEMIWPALKALSIYEGRYLLGTSLARPILARAQMEYAKEVGATVVAHGCTGKGNDQVRFELGYRAFDPSVEVIAPWRTWDIVSREDAIDYANRAGIPITATKEKIYSRDRNLWHISHEGGAIEHVTEFPPDDAWTWTTDPKKAPDVAQNVKVGFEAGVPVSVDGVALGPVALVETLNEYGAKHGVGRVDIVENRLVGMKSRGLYETPGGTILFEGLRTLRSLTVERDTLDLAERLAPEYARTVYNGLWFHPKREALDALFSSVMATCSGEVTVELYKGRATALAASSKHSLYRSDLASFTMGAGYEPKDSEGFVRLFGLPGTVAASVKRANA